jgi:hypothetical protein
MGAKGGTELTVERFPVAPPTFVESSAHFDPDYRLRPKLGEPWFGSGRTPTGRQAAGGDATRGRGGTGLHAEQEYEYHRPMRPGDVLSATVHWVGDGRLLRYGVRLVKQVWPGTP